MFYYKIDDGNIVHILGCMTLEEARSVAKETMKWGAISVGTSAPLSVVLFEKGAEKFRWSRADEHHETYSKGEAELEKAALRLSEAFAALTDFSLLDVGKKTALKSLPKVCVSPTY